MWSLLVAAALAAVVPEVPEGETRLGVLVCQEDCAGPTRWLAGRPEEADRPTLHLETLLASASEDDEALERFEQTLAEATAHARAGEWRLVEHPLDRAERALRQTRHTVPNEQLVALYLLQGAAATVQDAGGRATLEQAAAAAWNRDVALPVDDERVAAAWRDALRAVSQQPTGEIALDAPAGTQWFLDGVPLGEGALRVDALPGEHRITATDPAGRSFRATVRVRPGQRHEAVASFEEGLDLSTLAAELRAAVDGQAASAEIRDWLSRWCDRHGVIELRVLVLEPARGGRYTSRVAVYDPRSRQIVTGD